MREIATEPAHTFQKPIQVHYQSLGHSIPHCSQLLTQSQLLPGYALKIFLILLSIKDIQKNSKSMVKI